MYTRNPSAGTITVDLKEQLLEMAPHETRQGKIPIGHTASGQEIGIPYVLIRGETLSPCLWINAAVHGHESPGSAAVANFLHRIEGMKLTGSLIVTPVANPTAIDAKMKASPYDGIDLDDSFPGKTFLHSDRVAQKLFAAASSAPDYMVSVHTNGTPMHAGVYTVYKDPSRAGIDEGLILSLMASFAPLMACRIKPDNPGEVPRNLDGAIDAQMLSLGVPAFMVEFGGGGVWDSEIMEQSISGLFNLCKRTGVLPLDPLESDGAEELIRVDSRAHITTGIGGFFRPIAEPGDVLDPGELAGETINVFGEKVEELRFDEEILMIAIRKEPVTHPGERLALVGYSWEKVAVPSARPVRSA